MRTGAGTALLSCGCLLWPAVASAATDGFVVSARAGGREVAIDAFPWTGKKVETVFVSLPQAADVEGILVVPCARSAPMPAGMKLAGRGFASFGDRVEVFPIDAAFKTSPDGWRAQLSNVASFEVRAFDLVLPAAADLCIESVHAGTRVITPPARVEGTPAAADLRAQKRQGVRAAFREAGAEKLLGQSLADKDEQWRMVIFDDGTFAAWGRTPETVSRGVRKWKDFSVDGTFELGAAVKGKREIRLAGTLKAFERSVRKGSDEVARKPAGESALKDVIAVSAAGVDMRGKKPALGFSKMRVD